MAKLILKRGITNKLLNIFIQDSNSSSGSGLTGLTNSTSGLSWYYYREGDTTTTVVSAVSAVVGTYTSSGFVELDSVNMPGVYQIGIPNQSLSTYDSCIVMLKGATNMVPCLLELELISYNPNDAGSLGLSAVVVGTNNDKAGYSISGTKTTLDGLNDITSASVWGVGTRTLTQDLGIKKNTALNNFEFLMVDAGGAPLSGLSITPQRSIDGAAFGNCTNSASEVSNGIYKINLSTTDLNGDVITFKFTSTGANQRIITIKTNT